jgi:hypothetical protein
VGRLGRAALPALQLQVATLAVQPAVGVGVNAIPMHSNRLQFGRDRGGLRNGCTSRPSAGG